MSKLLFIPFSVIGGLLAGIVGKKVFQALWGAFDDQEPPNSQYRDTPLQKLLPALLLEGAIFRVVRGLFDHGARHLFSKVTGSWPGEEHAEPA